MGDSALTRTDKTSIYLVRFRWGSSELRLTDAGEDIYTALSSDPFLADAALEIDLSPRSGGVGEQPCKIRISRKLAIFADAISSGRAFAPVSVKVYELVNSFEQEKFEQKLLYVFSGKVVLARRNPEGLRGLVELEAQSRKNLLDFPAGMQANAECGNTFGRGGCSIDLSALADAGTITAINRNIVTITGVETEVDIRYWRRGFVERDGLRIQIKDWDRGTSFSLAKIPPVEWEDAVAGGGAAVTLYPGCDLLYKTCRDVWNNTKDFNGAGYATPPYNPVFENPEQ